MRPVARFVIYVYQACYKNDTMLKAVKYTTCVIFPRAARGPAYNTGLWSLAVKCLEINDLNHIRRSWSRTCSLVQMNPKVFTSHFVLSPYFLLAILVECQQGVLLLPHRFVCVCCLKIYPINAINKINPERSRWLVALFSIIYLVLERKVLKLLFFVCVCVKSFSMCGCKS